MLKSACRAALVALACLPPCAVASPSSVDMGPTGKAPPRIDPLLEPFLHKPIYSYMTLSPDGKHIAAIGYNPAGDVSAVVMLDADTMEANLIVQPRLWSVKGYRPYWRNPRSVYWLSDTKIAVNFTIADGAIFGVDGTPGTDLMQGYVQPLRDADGKPTPWHLVMRNNQRRELSRLNVEDGTNTSYDLDVGGRPVTWASDSSGDIRVVQTIDTAFWTDHSRMITWYRPSVGAAWEKVDERSIVDEPFRPLSVPNRPGRIVVQGRNGGDKIGIWDYDVKKHAFVDLLAGSETEDITGVMLDHDMDDINQVVTDGLRRTAHWLNTPYARLQASLDASLPDHVNVITPNASGRVLVYSYSDKDPGRWYLLDTKAMSMKLVDRRVSSIDPARMQPMQTLHYPSFDGLSIPAYLTLPGKPTAPAPLVVLIHGGPQARDRWAFDSEVQILAAHGYAVFQPQFRGSTGFGKHFEEAGYGQWGQAMQEDINAGVKYLVDQKIADPQRMCILGGSYGGYAALWALEKDPLLFKCGIDVAGVSDLRKMLHDDSDTSKSAVAREIVRHELGDASEMKVTFDSVSPLKHADRIVAPLLLVHGDLDQRVPVSHGKEMHEAMTDLKKEVEWIEFPDEPHGIYKTQNIRIYYAAVFKLLERTIGKGEPPFPPFIALPTQEIHLSPTDSITTH
ncbi:MAG: S9 family peptidase [Caulobacter sp.]|nr:S9 family peptidase [Vitreoscilla sp.]